MNLLLRGGVCATKGETTTVVGILRAFGRLLCSQEGFFQAFRVCWLAVNLSQA